MYGIHRLVFLTEAQWIPCEVRTEYLYIISCSLFFKSLILYFHILGLPSVLIALLPLIRSCWRIQQTAARHGFRSYRLRVQRLWIHLRYSQLPYRWLWNTHKFYFNNNVYGSHSIVIVIKQRHMFSLTEHTFIQSI